MKNKANRAIFPVLILSMLGIMWICSAIAGPATGIPIGISIFMSVSLIVVVRLLEKSNQELEDIINKILESYSDGDEE